MDMMMMNDKRHLVHCGDVHTALSHCYTDIDKHKVDIPMIRVYNMSRIMRKPVYGVYDQVGYKPDCTTIEDG